MNVDMTERPRAAVLSKLQCAVRLALTVTSFLAYAALAFNLQQSFDLQSYAIEREPMAAAVSNLIYGSPLGNEFEGVRLFLTDDSSPLRDKLAIAAQGKLQTGPLLQHTLDGLGLGYPLFVTATMRLFGTHLSALISGFLVLEAFAASLFLLRFQDERALIVALYFFALSVFSVTPIGNDPFVVGQCPVGGYRFFALLAIIPALHITLEMIDRGDRLSATFRLALLSAQALLLIGIYIVNASVLYVIVPLAVLTCGIPGARKQNREAILLLRKQVGAVLAVAIIAYASFYMAFQKHTGHIGDLFWHRMFISYGANPAWPFGDLNETYSACKRDIPRGLVPGIVDQNGHCVWDAFAIEKGLSSGEVNSGLYGAKYEEVLRSTFFKVLSAYPREAALTFFYYKPMMLLDTLRRVIRPSPDSSYNSRATIVGQTLLLIAFGILGVKSLRELVRVGEAVALMGAGTFILYFAAWGSLWTCSDLLAYILMLFGLTLVATSASLSIATKCIRHRVLPNLPNPYEGPAL